MEINMSLFDFFNFGRKSVNPFVQKNNFATPFIAIGNSTQPTWSARDYGSLAQNGFKQNAVAYRCIRMIAETASVVPIKLYHGRDELSEHPLLNLLATPNREQALPDLLETFYAYLQVAGDSYLELILVDDEPAALHVLRPDRVKIVSGKKGWPLAYEYVVGTHTTRFNIGDDKICRVLHQKLFNPLNDHYGMSPLEAAGLGVDIHNAANAWNKTLFDNAARPSGALVYRGPDGALNLTDEQFSRLKAELENNYQGARNAGRPLLLEGGLEWTPISLSPQDMDFIHAKHAAAREIALAFGVPPMLLGIPGDNTYANYAEANRAFWRQTILPLTERTLRAISHWLRNLYQESADLNLKPNLDAIPALSEERARLWQRIGKAQFLTINEQRIALGYGPIEGGDQLPKSKKA